MRLLLILICLNSSSVLFSQTEKEPEQILSFQQISEAIQRVFPEAYTQFTSVTFTLHGESILPERATFLIPHKIIKKKFSDKELKSRALLLLEQLEIVPGCHSISVGDPQEYAWHEWEDKIVCKVEIVFAIGC